MKFNKISKLLALALAGAMSVTALTACGGGSGSSSSGDSSSSESEGTEESGTDESAGGEEESSGGEESSSGGGSLIMAWWGNQVRNESTQKALDKYKEISGVSVEGQFFQWDDYWSKMATNAAGGNMPDLIQMDYSYIDQYVNNGQLLDLTPYMESGALDVSNIPENVLTMGVVGDGNYGIASGVNACCYYYNKTVTDEAGVEIKDNMTLDEFVEAAKIIAEKTGYRACLQAGTAYMTEWARGEGIPIVEAKMPVDSYEPYVAYFQLLKDGIDDGWVLPPENWPTSAIEESPLVYGSSPATMSWCVINGGSNLLTAFRNAQPEGANICVTTIPTKDPKTSNYLKPAMFYSISADTKDPDAAVALLDYLINSNECNEILLGERGVPASTAVADDIYDLVTETEQASFSFVTDVITPNCSPINPPDPEGSSELGNTLTSLHEAVAYGEKTPEEAAKEYYEKGVELWGE